MSGAELRNARRQAVGGPPAEWLAPTGRFRLPFEVRVVAGVDLARWAGDNPRVVDEWLHMHGAVLFTGLAADVDAFSAIAAALAGPALPYHERSTPRSEVAPGVYTSTEYPADQAIPLHNENTYQRCYPARLVFGCVTAAQVGGATPLADCRRILSRLDPAVVTAFGQRQVRYLRTFRDGVGLPWQEAFGQTDPRLVDEYCAGEQIQTHWRDGDLRTEQVRPALARHPRTGETTWFNHINIFHPSALPEGIREAMLTQFGPDGLAVDARYGDGSPIEPEAVAEIRAAYAAETVSVPWRAGDILLVDNVLVAHGREPYEGARRVVVSMAGLLCHDAPSGKDAR